MEKISINLLPVEVAVRQKATLKFRKVQFISIGVILVMIFLASLTFALGILQKNNIEVAEYHLQAAEGEVSKFKTKEGALLVLKNRVDIVSNIISSPSKQRVVYSLVSSLLPENASINALEVDKSGNLVITILSADSLGIDELLTNLVNPEKNEGSISKVEVEGFSRGRDGTYRASLKIIAK